MFSTAIEETEEFEFQRGHAHDQQKGYVRSPSQNAAGLGISPSRRETLFSTTHFMLGVFTHLVATRLLTTKRTCNNSCLRVVDDLEKEVQLDRSQRAQVDQILLEARQQYRETQPHVPAQLAEFRRATRTRVGALLRPEQRLLYDEWVRKRDLQREQRLKAGTHPAERS